MPFPDPIRYHIDRDPSLFERIRTRVGEKRVFCLMDEEVGIHCFPLLKNALTEIDLQPITVPTGEAQKNIDTCMRVWKELMDGGAERGSLLIALGGGVITDIGGFVAATYRRGMPCVLIPTSLLGMVDAAIGGKNGVDLEGYKNMIGTIRQPEDILIHPPFLRTLPERQLEAGYAEMLKHGLLKGGPTWQRIKEFDPKDEAGIGAVLEEAIEVKRGIVEADPEEEGLRESLNFGHTVGHALESLFMEAEDPLLHGEAVAFGMLVEAYLSQELIGFPNAALQELERTIMEHYGRLELPDEEALLEVMKKDKKRRGGELRSVLLEDIGKPSPAQRVDEAAMRKALRTYRERT